MPIGAKDKILQHYEKTVNIKGMQWFANANLAFDEPAYQRITADPQVKPPPIPSIRIRCPG